MYIDKYWGNYIGGSDDSLNLVEFLKDQNQDEIALAEIFTKIGLDKQNWDFRQTVGYLEYTNADGVDIDFHFAIDLVTDLAAILLECMVNGSVNLSDLDDYHTPSRKIRVTATVEEHDALNKSLADFAKNPLSYDLHELMDDDEIIEMAGQVEVLRRELYEAAGTNRNYHVKADDMRELLHDWEGADGCLATSRVMVEGCKVGFCYREQPDGDWDSGWRFTAGDESDEYMDDPMNSGIYKLNTVCNDDPDIIPLLTAPYNSAFERDENGVFRSVEDWQPSEAESADNADSVDNTESISELLARCQKWHEQYKHSKIIAELEALPDELRTAETDCELARAYNNEAEYPTPEGSRMLMRAVELLRAHEDELADDYSWNFRLAYAYYFLEREQLALPLFEKALELHPGDDPKLNTRQDIEELIESCKNTLTLPYFARNYKRRTAEAWQVFAEEESALRELIDNNKDNDRGEELVEKCNEILKTAFSDIAFELGHNGDKYELILSSEGDRTQLFELVYFKRHMPEELGERWNILIGRQPSDKPQIVVNGVRLSGDDVSVSVEKHGKDNIGLTLYCEKLADSELLENQTEWMLTLLVDQALGEIPATRYIDSFDVANEPLGDNAISLSALPERMKRMGLDLSLDAEKYLDLYTGYQSQPNNDPDADLRLDVMAGSTNCMSLLSAYLNNDDEDIDKLHNDGIAAGFICYPLDSFKGKDRSDQIFDFREKLVDTLSSSCESDLTLTGGATGLYCGYVDFIAWDLEAVIDIVTKFFDDTEIEWAAFHSFRRNVKAVTLKSPNKPDGSDGEPDDTDSEVDDVDDEDNITNENQIENILETNTDSRNESHTDTEETEMKHESEKLVYTPETAEDFYIQIDKWTDTDEYTKCIDALEAVPEEYRDYRYTYTFARTLENYAIIGDNNEGTPRGEGDKALLRAIALLESVRDEGQNQAAWNMRMAYGYQYLYRKEETALGYAKRWAELEPDSENAVEVIEELEAEIERNRRKSAQKAFKPGGTPFEGFDLTDFWDDNEYALKEYVSDPPSDELIAEVERELGYKLPESYIWLMKRHNGGMPKNTCYPTDEPTSWAEDHVAITGIFGIGRDKECSLCGSLGSKFMIDEWEYPDIGVAVCDCPSAGHDMIFLDYTECGPDGEPKVVHVDQENDYKITLLADSFEEFIRGLLPESDFDDDYAYCDDDDNDDDDNDDDDCDCRNCDCEDCGNIDDNNNDGDSDDSDNDENSHKGVFAGFVLMSKNSWDKEQLIHDLAEKWDITAQEDEDEDKRDDALVFDVDGMIAAISLMPYPIPDGEAEVNAENNYMWTDAVKAAKAHKAHIMVAVLGGNEDDLLSRGKLYVKLVAACCRQQYATGVYTSGVVFEPRFYESFADMLKDDELPIFNWIWFGLYRREKGLCGYTYGMDVFGKDEIEVLDADADPNDLRDFMASIVAYVLSSDIELHDGETIGFSEDDKHKITRSKGVSLPEEQMTLKISYAADSDDNNDDANDNENDANDDDGNDDSDYSADAVMDDASFHLEDLVEKELPVDEINAYNHMAIYLRWCIEHDLMSVEFYERYQEQVQSFLIDLPHADLRSFIRDHLSGQLFPALFNDEGEEFAAYYYGAYYGNNDSPFFPSDIDDYALEYFGPERYYSDEFKDEAYLFIPFDEKYYKAMAEVISHRFENWKSQDFDTDTLEPSELAQAMMDYLDCECRYFPSMKDDDPIMSAYSYAKRDGREDGYIPVLIKVDETLWECLIMNSDPDSDGAEDYAFDADKVAEYRKKLLRAPIKDGKAVLKNLIDLRKEEAEDDDIDWEDILGEIEGGYDNNRFASYWDSDTGMTYPLILAKIPVRNPWEIFAYLPFGNWNECPDTPELMAVAKYWAKQYGAVPVAMTHDELEFILPAPVSEEAAMTAALEQYGFCADIVDQGPEDTTVGSLADVLRQSTVWYFWWD